MGYKKRSKLTEEQIRRIQSFDVMSAELKARLARELECSPHTVRNWYQRKPYGIPDPDPRVAVTYKRRKPQFTETAEGGEKLPFKRTTGWAIRGRTE